MPLSADFSGRPIPAPYWTSGPSALYLGDSRRCLQEMVARSVHCTVTSPPYWGQRSYLNADHQHKASEIGCEPTPDCGTSGRARCGSCYVCSMVDVMEGVKRVLRDDGTLWLNIGDTYSGGKSGRSDDGSGDPTSRLGPNQDGLPNNSGMGPVRSRPPCKGIPRGNIIGVPWRVALALQANGWILRQEVIWYAPNKMPEPVDNRCTKSHEHLFLLTKSSSYYYDAVAIEEDRVDESGSKNRRDVWAIPTVGYPGAHYATFPPALVEPCILAGTSEYGCCAGCRRPWERVVERVGGSEGNGQTDARDRSFPSQRNGLPGSGSTLDGTQAARATVGWRKACGCHTEEVVPAVVLDPFVGSGTTVATAIRLGRAGVGIDLSEDYLRGDAIPRVTQALAGEGSRPGNRSVVLTPGSQPAPRRMRGP